METVEFVPEKTSIQKINEVFSLYCKEPIGLEKKKDDAIAIPLFQLTMREDKLRLLMMEVAEMHEIMCKWKVRKRNAAIDALLDWRYRSQKPPIQETIF